jgi:MFS family permease
MAATLAAVLPLLTGTALLMLGNTLLGILLPLELAAAGYSTAWVGLVMSSFFAGFMLGAWYGKTLIGRVGHIRVFAGLAALHAAAALMHPALGDSLPTVILLRVATGFAIAGLTTVMESWLSERSTPETRGRVFAIYLVTTFVAMGGGQLLLNLFPAGDPQAYMTIGALVCLSLIPVSLTRVHAPVIDHFVTLPLSELFRASPTGFAGALGAGLGVGALFGVGPLFARALGLGTVEITLFMGATIAGAALIQLPLGRLSDRYDRRLLLLAALILAILTCVALGRDPMSHGTLAVLAGGAAVGGFLNAIYPLSLAQTLDHVDSRSFVGASSGLLMCYSLGAVAGPVTASAAMQALGAPGFPLTIATTCLLLAAFTAHRMRSRAPVVESASVAYQAAAPVAGFASDLDPRLEESTEALHQQQIIESFPEPANVNAEDPEADGRRTGTHS